MKPSEFSAAKHKEQLDELFGGVGKAIKNAASSAMSAMTAPQMSQKDKMIRQEFINNFIGRAYAKLNDAINSQYVDVNLKSGTQQTAPTAPTAPTTPTARNPKRPKPAAAPKPLPAAPGSPANKAARMAAVQQQRAANKAGAFGFRGAAINARARGLAAFESKYEKMNSIFESIILNEAQSLGDYIQGWTTDYLRNDTNVQDPNFLAHLKKLALDFENSYATDKGKKALANLAAFAYTMADRNHGTTPQPGAQSAGQPVNPQQIAQTTQQYQVKAKQVIQLISTMSPKQQQKILAYLQTTVPAAAASQSAPASASTPAAPRTTP